MKGNPSARFEAEFSLQTKGTQQRWRQKIGDASADSEFVFNLSAGRRGEMQARDLVFIFVRHQSVQFHGSGQSEGSVGQAEVRFGGSRSLQHVRVAARVGAVLIIG